MLSRSGLANGTRAPSAARIVLGALPLALYLRRGGISIVHCNDGRTGLNWAVPALIAGVPLVWHQRAKYVPSRITERMLRLADRIVCNSQFTKGSLPGSVRSRASTIDNPFEIPKTAPDRAADRSRLIGETGLDPQTRLIGFFANYMERKRPMIVVEAVARLKSAGSPPVAGLLFGEDRDGIGDKIRARAEALGVGADIHHMGFRHPAEPEIAACDVLIAPAVDEPFGRTLVEAMLIETPVVAARSGGHVEIIEDGRSGHLANPDDVEDFARLIQGVFDNREQTLRITGKARQVAVERYSNRRHAVAMCGIYAEVLEGRNRRASS